MHEITRSNSITDSLRVCHKNYCNMQPSACTPHSNIHSTQRQEFPWLQVQEYVTVCPLLAACVLKWCHLVNACEVKAHLIGC